MKEGLINVFNHPSRIDNWLKEIDDSCRVVYNKQLYRFEIRRKSDDYIEVVDVNPSRLVTFIKENTYNRGRSVMIDNIRVVLAKRNMIKETLRKNHVHSIVNEKREEIKAVIEGDVWETKNEVR